MCWLAIAAGCGEDHQRPQAASNDSSGNTQTRDAGVPSTDHLNYGVPQAAPCATEGEAMECGRVYHTDGDYVTCSVGYQTCTDGYWSECVGDHLVIKSTPSLRLTSTGLRFQALDVGACTNICDPYCSQATPDPTDVSATGIVAADAGGVTLEFKEISATTATECVGLQCQLVLCGSGATTTISGTVYDPAGKNPLYDAQVYIPLHPGNALPSFGSGASCDTCGGAEALDAIRATQTNANGQFVLSDVPAGTKIPVVVQMGKWRREVMLSSVTACTSNTVKANCTANNSADCLFRLPRNQKDGYDPVAGTYTKADLPQTAIITGSADPFDCLLLKAGIDPTEIGDNNSSKRIHYYTSDATTTAGGSTLDSAYGAKVVGSTLWNNLSGSKPNMMSYDVVLLPCEGGALDRQKTSTNTPYKNLIDYVNSGGRTFVTHYNYSWLAFPAGYVSGPDNWSSVADWTPARVKYDAVNTKWTGNTINTQDPLTGTIDTTFPKGAVFSQWLNNVGGSPSARRLMVREGRQDLSAIGKSAQSWMTGKDLGYHGSPTYPNLFTFNTPYAAEADKQCGRVVYSDFHVSAAARTQCSNGSCNDDCLSDADCGYTATCNGETTGATGTCKEPCATNLDCPNSSFSCNGVAVGKCTQTACTADNQCGYGRTCQSGSCTCASNADCSGGSCVNLTCDPGTSCHSNAQCGKGVCGHGTGATIGSCKSGAVCHSNATCGPTGTCGTGTGSAKGTCKNTGGTACHKAGDCDSGICGSGTGSTAGTCQIPGGTVCHKNGDCDSSLCGSGTGSTPGSCSTGAQSCHNNGQCDSALCGSGTGSTPGTCNSNGQVCHSNATCDSGSCGVGTGFTGTCNIGAGTSCHANGDCDSGACGSGTGAVAGTCNIGAGASCHSNADCDTNTCGSGTGSSTGVCGFPTAAICHNNNQCDSGVCGSGTGGAAGTCNIGVGASCHVNTDCDSNSCGSGTGAVAGTCNIGAGASCHKAGDCDTNVCGSGSAGSTIGTCDTNGKSCHANNQCDSTFCGTGLNGSVKGKCGGIGAACSVDANCALGVLCLGATCTTNKTCGDDQTCGVSKLCNNATCTGPKSCAGDGACPKSGICNGAKCSGPFACTSDAGCQKSTLCNNAKCSTIAACTSDAGCPKSGVCNGAKCGGTKSCTADTGCQKSQLCNNATCSGPTTCSIDSNCPKSGLCNNAKCTNLACGDDSTCTKSNLCNGAKCATKACGDDSVCTKSNLCSGAKCATPAACGADSSCTSSKLCNNAKCSTPATGCTGDASCPSSGLCNNAKCSTSTCGQDSECPLLLCTGATCNASDCSGDTDCATGAFCGGSCTASGCTKDSDCESGLCVAGVCGCTTKQDCGGAQVCNGGAQGTCGRACTTDAQCAPDRCVNGQCGGCSGDSDCHDYSYPSSCQGIPAQNYGTCSDASGTEFPVACKQGDLSAQEKALEFMFFDLTACVTPDNLPPPKPVTTAAYGSATFVQDFEANCKGDTSPVWRDFDWQADIPDGASIEILAQTGDSIASLVPALPLSIVTAVKKTDPGPAGTTYDIALIDTGTTGSGAFSAATPQIHSGNLLRVTIQMNPTVDKKAAPRLAHWKVQYDCVPAQ